MAYHYIIRSGIGLRFDIIGPTGTVGIAHTEENARLIVAALNAFEVKK